MIDLTHIDSNGNAIMVDVSEKDKTERTATAIGSIYMEEKTLKLITKMKILENISWSIHIAQLVMVIQKIKTWYHATLNKK